MNESEISRLVRAASLEISASVAETMRHAGARDDRFSADHVSRTRFGSRAEIEIQRDAAPTRYEAVDLVWPAIDEETSKALGQGDWQPSLLWIDVIELRDEPPGG
jgi:hypothetical protein